MADTIVKKHKLPEGSTQIKAVKEFDLSLTMLDISTGSFSAGDIVYSGQVYRDFGDAYDYKNCAALMVGCSHTIAVNDNPRFDLVVENSQVDVNYSSFRLTLSIQIKAIGDVEVTSGGTKLGIRTRGHYMLIDKSLVSEY